MYRNTHASVGQNQGQSVVSTWASLSETRISRLGETRPRGGISLTEVLIAMGILTVGLLGVASIFPVGSYYMQKGDVADRGSAIAQAAFNDVISRGMLDPETWLMWEDGVIKPGTPAQIAPGIQNLFTRRIPDKLRQQSAQLSANAAMLPPARQWNVGTEFGAAFVIDPIAAASISWPTVTYNYGTKFPATAFRLDPTAPDYSPSWQPWYFQMPSQESRMAWPVRRVTLPQGPLTPLSMAVAERLFTSSDDLSIDVPTASDKPSKQNLQLANLDGGSFADDPLARQSRGDYSWIVTVSPGSSDALNALASDPSAFSYEVSVAVFYKRVLGKVAPKSVGDVAANIDLLMQNERLVGAKVISTGLSGGELLLQAIEPTAATESPFAGLKVGNWYLLAAPHPNSTGTQPMFVARWYRVLSIEGKDSRLDANGNPTTNPAEPERRLVTLRGPQWPWQPQSNIRDLSNNLCLGIIPNVVAVHSKTLRLEGNSAWSIQ